MRVRRSLEKEERLRVEIHPHNPHRTPADSSLEARSNEQRANREAARPPPLHNRPGVEKERASRRLQAGPGAKAGAATSAQARQQKAHRGDERGNPARAGRQAMESRNHQPESAQRRQAVRVPRKHLPIYISGRPAGRQTLGAPAKGGAQKTPALPAQGRAGARENPLPAGHRRAAQASGAPRAARRLGRRSDQRGARERAPCDAGGKTHALRAGRLRAEQGSRGGAARNTPAAAAAQEDGQDPDAGQRQGVHATPQHRKAHRGGGVFCEAVSLMGAREQRKRQRADPAQVSQRQLV